MKHEFERVDLGSGVLLHGLQTEKFKSLCIHAVFQVPLDERAPGVSLIPSIIRRGTRSYPDMVALGRRCEELFGTAVSADASRRGERMLFSVDLDVIDAKHLPGHPEVLGPALDLFGEWILEPASSAEGFVQDYFEQERQNQIHAIRSIVHDPARYAADRLRQVMCGAEPYGIPPLGTVEEVQALEITATYRLSREILRAAPLAFFFVGPRPVMEIAEVLKPLVHAMDRSDPIALTPPVPHPPCAELRRIEEEQPLMQGKLAMGMRIPQDPDHDQQIGMALMATIYGGGTFSKLFREVREKRSLAYFVSSGIERSKGLLFVQAGVDAENGPAVIDLSLELLDEMRRGVFEDDVLEYARRTMINRLQGVGDSAGELIGFELDDVITGRGWTIRSYEEGLQRAGRERIIEAACAVVPDVAFFLKPAPQPVSA